jgi:hypothetical protein
LTTVAKDYYQDESFCKNENGEINLWKFYNLLTGANAFDFTNGISEALHDKNSKHGWFLQ